MKKQLRGIFPVIPTPFHEDMSVDYDAVKRVVDFCLDCGAHGFLTTAMASEFYTLTDSEHNQIVETIISHTAGRVPVVVGIASRSIPHGVMFAKHAQDVGADAIMSTPPVVESVLGKVTWDKARAYYNAIDEAVSIPIFIQNAPELGGTLTAEQMMQLAAENEHLQYAKEEGRNSQQITGRMMELWKKLPEGSFSGVFSGGGGFTMIGDMTRGACGIMPCCAVTDLYVDIWNMFQDGNIEGARKMHNLVVIAQLYEKNYWNAFTKSLLIKRGVLTCDAIRETTPLYDETCYKETQRIYDLLKPYFRV